MDKDTPYISDDFQIGPEGAFEYSDEELYEFSLWEVTLLDGLEDLES